MYSYVLELLHKLAPAVLAGLFLVSVSACGGSDDGGSVVDPGPAPGVIGDDDDNEDDGEDNDDPDNPDDTDTNENALSFETFQAASLVIGQSDFSGSDINQGGATPDANTLNMPLGGVYSSESDTFFIADSDNARVLGFNGVPDVDNANADFVLGQQDFTSSERNINAAGMFSPEAVTTNGGNLMVTDTDLNRVTVYDGIPTSGNVEPVLVIGQPSLDAYSGACDQSTLIHPHDHFLAPDGKFLVADAANNRVLVWNEMPTENGAPADMVLGQEDFTVCSFRGVNNFKHPAALWTDGEMLIIADSEKHRVLIWNTFPTTSFEEPDVILGQSALGLEMPNDDNQDGETDASGEATARTLSYPRDIAVHEGKLYVADMDNHRVLMWNTIPTQSFTPADNVLGQPDFTSNAMNAGEAAPNAQGFRRPVGVAVIGNQLFVTEWENSRVVVFDAQDE